MRRRNSDLCKILGQDSCSVWKAISGAIREELILIYDNPWIQRFKLDENIKVKVWNHSISEYFRIEYLWEYVSRQLATLSPLQRSLNEPGQKLFYIWSLRPIPVSYNLINIIEVATANGLYVGTGKFLIKIFFLIFFVTNI